MGFHGCDGLIHCIQYTDSICSIRNRSEHWGVGLYSRTVTD